MFRYQNTKTSGLGENAWVMERSIKVTMDIKFNEETMTVWNKASPLCPRLPGMACHLPVPASPVKARTHRTNKASIRALKKKQRNAKVTGSSRSQMGQFALPL